MKHISESLPEVEEKDSKPKIIDIPEADEEKSSPEYGSCPDEICDGSGTYEDEDGNKRRCPHTYDDEADMDDDSADEL